MLSGSTVGSPSKSWTCYFSEQPVINFWALCYHCKTVVSCHCCKDRTLCYFLAFKLNFDSSTKYKVFVTVCYQLEWHLDVKTFCLKTASVRINREHVVKFTHI